MEGTCYNGRQKYVRKVFDKTQTEAKTKELLAFQQKFEESVEELRLAEGSQASRRVAARVRALVAAPANRRIKGNRSPGQAKDASVNAPPLAASQGVPATMNSELSLATLQVIQQLDGERRLKEILAAQAQRDFLLCFQSPTLAPVPERSLMATLLAGAQGPTSLFAAGLPVGSPQPLDVTGNLLLALAQEGLVSRAKTTLVRLLTGQLSNEEPTPKRARHS